MNHRRPQLSWLVTLRSATHAACAVLLAVAGIVISTSGPATALPRTTIWLAGDSTMAFNSGGAKVGWGAQFAPYFGSDVRVVNNAAGGRSIQTWMYEGGVSTTLSGGECRLTSTAASSRWRSTLDGMRSGDYLFISFGINDGARTCPQHVGTSRFQSLMQTMAQAAIARGAHPILLTPTSGMSCSGSTAVANRGYGSSTMAAGTATSSPVIDLTRLSVALYNRLRLCPNNGNYRQGALGAFFADRTHFKTAGAQQISGLVATALADKRIPLAAYLRNAPPGTVTPPPVTPPPGDGGPTLVSVASGRCLSVAGNSRAAGSAIQIQDCNGAAGQQWSFTAAGELRTFNGTMCLDANAQGTSPLTKLISYPCHGGANQKFAWGANGTIVGRQSNLVVDVTAKATINGTAVILYTRTGGTNQHWRATGR